MRVRKLLAVLAVTTLTAGVGVVAMGAAPTGAAETSGYTIVAIDQGGCQLSTIDLTTGAVAGIGATALESCVADLAVAPDGTVYGLYEPNDLALGVDLIRFDTTTGAPTDLGVLTGTFTDSALKKGGITFAADGTMLVHMVTDEAGCDNAAVCLYRVDPATLTSTLVGPQNQGETSFFYLTTACSGTTLSTQDQANNTAAGQNAPFGDDVQAADFGQRLTSWNTGTGASAPGADLFAGLDVAGLEFDRVTGTLYLLAHESLVPEAVPDEATTDPPAEQTAEPQYASGVSLYTVDVATGATTLVADLDADLIVDSLGIAGTCAAPAVEIVPTFTG